MNYYVYKYVNDMKQIGYIGLTTNLSQRIKQHINDKIGISEYQNIYYFECQNKREMESWEYFLINKYSPPLNIIFKNQISNSIELQEPEWILYNKNNISSKQILINQNKKNKQIDSNKSYNQFSSKLKQDNEYLSLPSDLLFPLINSAFPYKVLISSLLKFRMTQNFEPITRNEFCEYTKLKLKGGGYDLFPKALESLNTVGLINYNYELININLFSNFSNEQLYSLISKDLGKYDWFFIELINYTNFSNFKISLQDLIKISGYERGIKDIRRRCLNFDKLNEALNKSIEYIDIKNGRKIEGIEIILK